MRRHYPTLIGAVLLIAVAAAPQTKDPFLGARQIDADNWTFIERVGKESGKVSEICTMKISADGKTLTVTTKGEFRGTPYSSVQILKHP